MKSIIKYGKLVLVTDKPTLENAAKVEQETLSGLINKQISNYGLKGIISRKAIFSLEEFKGKELILIMDSS